MTGNVWEWVWDRHVNYPVPGEKTNPKGPEAGANRLLRGGGWTTYDLSRLRVTFRNVNPPTIRDRMHGFRLVLDVD
jgi:formylglycine-generating enzyme required for sulfatase activity